jgi:hypothetical protein
MYIHQAKTPQLARGLAHEVDALTDATTGATVQTNPLSTAQRS